MEEWVTGEEDLVLDTEEPFLETLLSELTPVSVLSEFRLIVSEKTGSEFTRCIVSLSNCSAILLASKTPYKHVVRIILGAGRA